MHFLGLLPCVRHLKCPPPASVLADLSCFMRHYLFYLLGYRCFCHPCADQLGLRCLLLRLLLLLFVLFCVLSRSRAISIAVTVTSLISHDSVLAFSTWTSASTAVPIQYLRYQHHNNSSTCSFYDDDYVYYFLLPLFLLRCCCCYY